MRTKVREDREGNFIGNGEYNVEYTVLDFSEYANITSSVSLSDTTESVYVYYKNEENGKKITVRFSDHVNNAVGFGDQLDGRSVTKNEILFHLGLKNRIFIPNTHLSINKRNVSKKDMEAGLFEFAELTIKEMYDLGKDGDLSQYKGKIAKNSNYLILGDKVEEFEETGMRMGKEVTFGKYIYE